MEQEFDRQFKAEEKTFVFQKPVNVNAPAFHGERMEHEVTQQTTQLLREINLQQTMNKKLQMRVRNKETEISGIQLQIDHYEQILRNIQANQATQCDFYASRSLFDEDRDLRKRAEELFNTMTEKEIDSWDLTNGIQCLRVEMQKVKDIQNLVQKDVKLTIGEEMEEIKGHLEKRKSELQTIDREIVKLESENMNNIDEYSTLRNLLEDTENKNAEIRQKIEQLRSKKQ